MKCRDFLVTNGVVLRAVGDTIIGAPPFVLSHAEADELVDKAWLGLELTRKAVAD
jgi:putrescine aminotransferase